MSEVGVCNHQNANYLAMMTERDSALAKLASANGGKAHQIWYPLFDTPVTVTMSREQMQSLADELRGVNVCPGWAEHFAGQLDHVLKNSLKE